MGFQEVLALAGEKFEAVIHQGIAGFLGRGHLVVRSSPDGGGEIVENFQFPGFDAGIIGDIEGTAVAEGFERSQLILGPGVFGSPEAGHSRRSGKGLGGRRDPGCQGFEGLPGRFPGV